MLKGGGDLKMDEKKTICLCWLSECDCQFQRHRGSLTICENHEIYKKCLKNEDLNDGGM